MTAQEALDQRVFAYIRKIRNQAKRAYAMAWWLWLTEPLESHQEQQPGWPGLSYIGAQAVRHRIRQIMDSQESVPGVAAEVEAAAE